MIKDNHTREAFVIGVYDGDTITVEVLLWKGRKEEFRVRLKGINAAEMKKSTGERKELALKAKQFVRDRVLGKKVQIEAPKFEEDDFSRVLGTVYYMDGEEQKNLNQVLLEEHLAQVYYKGASKDFGEWKE